jgi:hypothetical protein
VALAVGLSQYASLQLERRGVVAPGEVLRKREDFRVRRGSWSRHLSVTVRYHPATSSGRALASVPVDETTFDRLRVGAPVSVRYPPPSWLTQLGLARERLADQPAGTGPSAALGAAVWGLLPLLASVLLAGGLIVLWRRTKSWLAAVGAAAAALIAFTFIYAPETPPAPTGPVGRATAVVREVHRVTKLGPQGSRGEEAPSQAYAPYQLVELAFVPAAVGDTVLAMDAVDDRSVPGLAPGARLAVTYALADARVAQIDGASRTFARKNVAGIWTLGPLVLIAIAILVLGWTFLRRLWARAAERRPPRAWRGGP